MKKNRLIGTIACLLLILSACGFSGEGTEPVGAGDDQTDQGKENANERDTITVGVENANSPFSFIDENGELTGFDVDVLEAIAEDQGLNVNFKSMNFSSIVPSLQTGQLDAAISTTSLGPSPEKEGKVDFANRITNASSSIVSKKGSSIEEIEDIHENHVIAVKTGSLAERIADILAEETGAEIRRFDTSDKVLQDVVNEQSDVAVDAMDTIYAVLWQDREYGIQILSDSLFQYVMEALQEEAEVEENENGTSVGEFPYNAIAVTKGDQELIDMLNAGFQNIKADGKFDEIQAKWNVALTLTARMSEEFLDFMMEVNPILKGLDGELKTIDE
ncbi:ABC transporter substrate-binding protein [Bacillus spongiae]|uniref:ABC transporter substrate-binding protein n=1 Tax=Bacillus spongiae TaxID=2683610 RepID=A0ABU8HBQ0_9BACI